MAAAIKRAQTTESLIVFSWFRDGPAYGYRKEKRILPVNPEGLDLVAPGPGWALAAIHTDLYRT
jgi:hypothetical protein